MREFASSQQADPEEIIIAALARRDFRPGQGEHLGFVPAAAEPAAARDFNFDTALERYVPRTVTAGGAESAKESELRRRFCPEGKIALIISTRETDQSKLGHVGNVGDNFGYWVTRNLSGLDVVPYGVWADQEMPAMLTVGSFIQHARNRGLVWGTGTIAEIPYKIRPVPTSSVFAGVRGPRTREVVLRRFGINPPVIGDPGLLIRDMVPPALHKPDHELGFVLHEVDREFFRQRWPGHFIADNDSSFEAVAADIQRCKRVITSSLHGLIFAHALGVQAEVVRFGDRVIGEEFKFVDYMQSVGNYGFRRRIDLSGASGPQDWVGMAERGFRPDLSAAISALPKTFPLAAGNL